MSSDYSFIIFYCHFNYIVSCKISTLVLYLLVLCSSYANIEEKKLNKKQLDKRERRERNWRLDWTLYDDDEIYTHTKIESEVLEVLKN